MTTLVGIHVRFWELDDDVLRPYAATITESQAEDPRLGEGVVNLTLFCSTSIGSGVVQQPCVPHSDTPKHGHWTEIPR